MSPSRRAAVAELAAAVLARRQARPLRIAIDGRTASGKTTLSAELADVLRSHGPVILAPLDGFHRPRAERWAQGRDSARGYFEDGRDYHQVRARLLNPLGPGGDRLYVTQGFDLDADEPVRSQPASAAEDAMLIVEGSFLQHPTLSGAWDVVVLVEVSRDEAVARGAARDADRLGGIAAARALHDRRYADAWDRFYAPLATPQERADIIFRNSEFDAPEVRDTGGLS